MGRKEPGSLVVVNASSHRWRSLWERMYASRMLRELCQNCLLWPGVILTLLYTPPHTPILRHQDWKYYFLPSQPAKFQTGFCQWQELAQDVEGRTGAKATMALCRQQASMWVPAYGNFSASSWISLTWMLEATEVSSGDFLWFLSFLLS